MFCKYCGAELPEGSVACTECGKAFEESVKKTVVVDTPEADALATSALTYGIIGAVLIWLFSPVGIVFSYLAMKKAKEYKALTSVPSTKANIANILALAGFVLNIIATVMAVLSIVFFVVYIVFIIGVSTLPAFLSW